jgi:hypothetical protein
LRLRSEGVVIAGDKIDMKRFGHSFTKASDKSGASDKPAPRAKLKTFGKP